MTRRDIAWRLAGIVMIAAACASAGFDKPAAGWSALIPLAGFTLAITGLVIAVQGKRIPAAFRIERSRHRLLPMAIRMRRGSGRPNA